MAKKIIVRAKLPPMALIKSRGLGLRLLHNLSLDLGASEYNSHDINIIFRIFFSFFVNIKRILLLLFLVFIKFSA